MKNKTNVLWVSRHNLCNEQYEDLQLLYGDTRVKQIDRSIKSAYELKQDVLEADVVCVVAPYKLQQQFLNIAQDRPLLVSNSHRIRRGDGSCQFRHAGWSQVLDIKVELEKLTYCPAPS